MIQKRTFAPIALLAGVLIFAACPNGTGAGGGDSFFSSSWGTGAARTYDPAKIEVNAGNIDSLILAAKSNPAYAAAITESIKNQLEGKVEQGNPTADQAKLQEGGVTLAIDSSGVGTSIVTNTGHAVEDLKEGDLGAVGDLLKNIKNDFNKNDGKKAASNLSQIVKWSLEKKPGDYSSGDAPRFTGNYATAARPTDVGQAVMILILAKTDNIDDFDDLADENTQNSLGISIKDTNGKKEATVTGNPPSLESITLAAYLNLIADNPGKYENNPITKGILGAFGF